MTADIPARLGRHKISRVLEDRHGAIDLILSLYKRNYGVGVHDYLANDLMKLVGYRIDLLDDSCALHLWQDLSREIDRNEDEPVGAYEARLRCFLETLQEKELLAMIGLSIMEVGLTPRAETESSPARHTEGRQQ